MGIIALTDAKAQLNITNTDHDVELQAYIDAATGPVENVVGPVTPQKVVEVHESGHRLFLGNPPVMSLSLLEPVLTDGESYSPADLDVNSATGVVRRLDGGGFSGPLRVTYQAGRNPVPAHIDLAARIIVEHLWQTQRGQLRRPGLNADEDDSPREPLGFLVPHRAMELLMVDKRGPVVM